ncbi:MAG: hypothetical protein A3F84_02615 [Candidatus Handelsmanbacteria bacterium RIFCSPLOWO2_12_FULL_64_10]|uniref:Uncharacterized protein n=1 Tax=Handelsmanbacteria sp. (strain RIFCSPLOWO2_12_FULL_64_10) TaxID=1817868 RepID=A0A1F6CM29_HANXR|nr:MAG: hypothetical protein A3F84_02615 [Candidatus Handelsmanbacteria bacterium RIFCSPLOWO2_12_FULL_64_10]
MQSANYRPHFSFFIFHFSFSIVLVFSWIVEGQGQPLAPQPPIPALVAEGRRRLQAGDAAGAASLLRRAVQANPDDANARAALGVALRGIDPVRGRYQLWRAVALRPEHAEALYHLGALSLQEGDQAQAREMLERAARAGARNLHLHEALAYLYAEVDRFADAVQHLRRAMEIAPGESKFRLRLAVLQERSGAYPEAVQALKDFIATSPDVVEAHLLLGHVYLLTGRPQEAVAPLRRAVALRPVDAKARYQLGQALLQAGRPSEATSELREAVRLSPDYAEARYALGQAYLKAGEGEKARREMEAFQKRHAEREREASRRRVYFATWGLGVEAEARGDLKRAAEALQQAVAVFPEDERAHLQLSQVYEKQGLQGAAQQELRRARGLLREGDLGRAYLALGVELLHQGALSVAAEALERAVRMDPALSRARYQLVLLYDRLGRAADRDRHAKALEE